jgi:ribosomal 30S subunit maturation factor RimM
VNRRIGDVAPPNEEAHPPAGWVRLARLGRTFRLKGELRAYLADPALGAALAGRAERGERVWLSGLGPSRLRLARRLGDGWVLAFQGIYTPERARELTGRELWGPEEPPGVPDDEAGGTPRHELPDAVEPPLAYLIGASVRLDGAPYGRVLDVVSGAQDLVLVEGRDGRRWVPWGAPYVRWDADAVAIDDPPRGLLDDD